MLIQMVETELELEQRKQISRKVWFALLSVGNLAAPVAEWTVGGTPLTSLMEVERRHGKFKLVIKRQWLNLMVHPSRNLHQSENSRPFRTDILVLVYTSPMNYHG
ncbi:putative diphosphate--fructose-6-phosphate 1-phosphotransferase [Helianthus anomalus]